MVEQNAEGSLGAAETRLCGMCQKQIDVAKFRLHESACARMNYKCPKCGEIVLKAEREQHDEDEHSDKPVFTCDLCSEYKTKDQQALAHHK